jgi:hypothetical protein
MQGLISLVFAGLIILLVGMDLVSSLSTCLFAFGTKELWTDYLDVYFALSPLVFFLISFSSIAAFAYHDEPIQ